VKGPCKQLLTWSAQVHVLSGALSEHSGGATILKSGRGESSSTSSVKVSLAPAIMAGNSGEFVYLQAALG